MKCINCGDNLKTRFQLKYCSNKCQADHQYGEYINDWKKGKRNGNKGVLTKNTSRHLRKYLINKYGENCIVCGWNKKHPITGNVPIEIDHVDGDAENNSEGNLRLLCPNCHALTPHFRNLNKGNGRKWRVAKYIKN